VEGKTGSKTAFKNHLKKDVFWSRQWGPPYLSPVARAGLQKIAEVSGGKVATRLTLAVRELMVVRA